MGGIWLILALVLSEPAANRRVEGLQATEAAARFEDLLKAATGPAQLRELEKYCAKNKLDAERKRVHDILGKAPPPAKPPADFRARESARTAGDVARDSVDDFREKRAKTLADEVRKVVAWMAAESYAPPEAKERVRVAAVGLLADAPVERAALESEIKALAHAEKAAEDVRKTSTAFESRMKELLRKFTNQIFGAVDKCFAAGEPGYAFDLYRFLLRVDPDNEKAHKSLGETKVEGEWLRPYEMEQYRAGFVWDDRFGFVPKKGRERLQAGEAWDPGAKAWGKLADLNKAHAEASNPWKLESEHFKLVSTADLELNVRLIARMEAYFLQAFRQYDLFFAGKGGKSAGLIFGMAPTAKRLTVNFYRDEAQFRQFANPPTTWAAGFYSGGKGASFFYGRPNDFSVGLMQHELTHQILGEYSDGGSGGGAWLTEGAAVYLQYAEFRGGQLSLGGLKDNGRVAEYRRNLRNGQKEHSFKDMVTLFGPGGDWDQGDISKNYRGAGASVFFLMSFDGGRFRADTIQLLRDAYFAKPRPLEEYFGITVEGLDFLMARFYKDCDVP